MGVIRLDGYLGCSVLGRSISGGPGKTDMPTGIMDGLAGSGDEVACCNSRGESPGWGAASGA
jgi:hypothetical protein